MENNLVVRKHNDVNEACYKMSVPEMRLILSCVAQIDFEQIITKEDPFYISAVEYSKIFGVDQKNVHREIKKAVAELWDAEIIIPRENKKPLITRWISAKAEYGDGGAEIHWASDVIPYLMKLHENGNYTMYQLENVGGLKSAYGIRLYELLIQYKTVGERKIQVQELREILCLGDKYKKMCNLKARVLDVAIKEINAETDLNISYKNIKRGRSIIALHFTIKGKRKAPEVTPKNPKKHLSPEDTYKEFQKPRFRHIQNYQEGFEILEKEGYTLNKTAFMVKYKR
jgi:plasmid replication initiation protein